MGLANNKLRRKINQPSLLGNILFCHLAVKQAARGSLAQPCEHKKHLLKVGTPSQGRVHVVQPLHAAQAM